MHELDRHLALSPTGAGRHRLELTRDWWVGGGVNGGFLMAAMGRALGLELPKHPHPLAFSAHFVSAATEGDATLTVTPARVGGSTAAAAVTLSQGDETRVVGVATCGDLARLPEDVRTTAVPPVLPPPEECIPTSSSPAEVRRLAPLIDRYDLRMAPESAGWAVGAPSGRGELQAWVRMADDRPPDALSLLAIADVLPPVSYDLGEPGWAPTMQLAAHLRALPAPGWLQVTQSTRNVAGGMFEQDCEVWDSAGRLVVQARQLARMPRPAVPSGESR
ncbi:thioesterase family protein [Nocardioides limicola]|uniref:thioesterase family protein n=1 Tax=Nocardioides limicola TaxID=2803368 RepID=UPI0027DD42C1|nr:thioesterase family protein [Nocardioides sp. DJM-14]